MKTLNLHCFGITIQYQEESKCSAYLSSDMKGCDIEDNTSFNSAIDGLESLILAHFCAGIRVDSPTYLEGIETSYESLLNRFELVEPNIVQTDEFKITCKKTRDFFNIAPHVEIVDKLLSSQGVSNSLIENWTETSGQEWSTENIIENLRVHFNVDVISESVNFNVIRTYYNQQMMFEMCGYKSEQDFHDCKDEMLSHVPYPFLVELQMDCLKRSPFVEHDIVKVRSVDGNYSAKTHELPDIFGLVLDK
jgi:hypothetical protein